jgi:hypothetical protein
MDGTYPGMTEHASIQAVSDPTPMAPPPPRYHLYGRKDQRRIKDLTGESGKYPFRQIESKQIRLGKSRNRYRTGHLVRTDAPIRDSNHFCDRGDGLNGADGAFENECSLWRKNVSVSRLSPSTWKYHSR